MSSQSYSAPLQPYHIRNLIRILRDANSHYRRVAEQIRERYNPTHHARTRAQKLGLTVNVAKAVACDHRHVSTVPLPIIEQAYSPIVSVTSSTSLQCLHLSPLVPTVLTKTTPNGTTSAFSSASAYSFVSLAGTPMDEDDKDENCGAEIQHPTVPIDIPIDATLIEWSIYDQYMSEGISVKVDYLTTFDSDDSPLSSPSTADSSTGPSTPEVQTLEPITLRVKRKSAEITEHTSSDFEKRPKLAREYGWDPRIPEHRHIIRIPARRP